MALHWGVEAGKMLISSSAAWVIEREPVSRRGGKKTQKTQKMYSTLLEKLQQYRSL